MNRALYITEIVLCGLQIVETYIFKEKMNYYKIEFAMNINKYTMITVYIVIYIVFVYMVIV